MFGPLAGHVHSPAPQWAVVMVCSFVAAVMDWRSRRIPNALTGPMLLAGLISSTWFGGAAGLGDALLAAFVLAIPYVILFLVAGGGAADAKLMAAVGAWLGLQTGTIVLLSVCMSGAAIGIVYAVARGRARSVFINITVILLGMVSLLVGRRRWHDVAAELPPSEGMLKIPYGLAVFAGVCVAALGIHLVQDGG